MAAQWTEQELWQRYVQLTRELMKSINRNNIDLFLDQVDQRQKLMEMMQQLPPSDYRQSEACKAMIEEIKPFDMQIIYKAKAWLNKSRRQNTAVRNYDLVGHNPLGHKFNKSY